MARVSFLCPSIKRSRSSVMFEYPAFVVISLCEREKRTSTGRVGWWWWWCREDIFATSSRCSRAGFVLIADETGVQNADKQRTFFERGTIRLRKLIANNVYLTYRLNRYNFRVQRDALPCGTVQNSWCRSETTQQART